MGVARRSWVGVACSLLITLAALAQGSAVVKFPETQAGQRAAGFLTAFNANDQAKAQAYIIDNVAPDALTKRPLQDRLAVYRQLYEDTGEWKLVKLNVEVKKPPG